MTKYKKLTRSTFAIVALCLALVGILAFGGTYAYFSAIDEGYRGEYGVIMTNYSPMDTKDNVCTIDDKGALGTFHIRKGDRVAQIVMSRYITMNLRQVEDITTIAGDRGGGFGSSGVK